MDWITIKIIKMERSNISYNFNILAISTYVHPVLEKL